VALDNLTSSRVENVPTGATFVEGDCGDVELVTSLGRFDACIHFAGRIEPGLSMEQPEVFFANNVGSSFRLIETLLRTGLERFVFSSSCAVYGDQVEMPIDEDRATRPHSPYGESKLMVEQGLKWLVSCGRLKAATLRYFNAAGGTLAHPEQHDPEIHLIPIALDVAAGRRERLEIYGSDYPTPDGTCIRDYVHVSDLAEAHVLAIAALDEHSEVVVNLGSGAGSSNREVVEAVRRVTERDFNVNFTDRRPGDPAIAVASSERSAQLLKWKPTRSQLDTIVSDAWTAYNAR